MLHFSNTIVTLLESGFLKVGVWRTLNKTEPLYCDVLFYNHINLFLKICIWFMQYPTGLVAQPDCAWMTQDLFKSLQFRISNTTSERMQFFSYTCSTYLKSWDCHCNWSILICFNHYYILTTIASIKPSSFNCLQIKKKKTIASVMWHFFQFQTPDLCGKATTTDVVKAIIEDIKPKTRTW